MVQGGVGTLTPANGAQITVVNHASQTLASIFSDNGVTPSINPVVTNAQGEFGFYVADGRYDLIVTGNGFATFNLLDIEITDILQATASDAEWVTEGIEFVNQPGPPPIPPTGQIDLYSLASTKHIYIQDDTGLVTDLTLSGGGGGGGGTPPTGPTNSLQKNSGTSTFSPSSITDNGTTVSIAEDAIFRGPDPYTDVRAYGVRATAVGVTPFVPGITATISGGSSSVALSGLPASPFLNGDGVTIYGAGAPCSLSTPGAPLVTPGIASGGTGIGLVANANAGSTVYNYAIVARDKLGCLTAASPVTVMSTGNALGTQTIAITGFTRSGNTVTATTSAPHGLVVFASAYIQNTNASDNFYFGGWMTVTAVPDANHFTWVSATSVAGGAPAVSGAGGSANYWSCNHLTWTAVPNATNYYIYGRSGGSLTLLGVTRPQNLLNSIIDTTWEDYGSPMMDNIKLPFFVPTTAPGTPLPLPLTTTIISGAGTTTMTLAAPAVSPVSGSTILFDNTPNILTAASNTIAQSLLYFPAGTYVVNSYLTMPGDVAIQLADATLFLNDTMEVGSTDRFYGNLLGQGRSTQSFGWGNAGGFIQSNRANPGVFGPNGLMLLNGINIGGPANGLQLVLDNMNQDEILNTNFSTLGAGDYTGVCLILRSSGGSFWNKFDNVSFNTGPGQSGGGFNGSTATPSAIFTVGGVTFRNLSVQDRGLMFLSDAIGTPTQITFEGISRSQGGITPFISFTSGFNSHHSFNIGDVEMDTSQNPIFANMMAAAFVSFAGSVSFTNGGTGPAAGYAALQGGPINGGVFGSNGQNFSATAGSNFTNNTVTVNNNGQFTYLMPIPTAPASAVVSAGGNVPVGTHTYSLIAIDINGRTTTIGPSISATTTLGNQTVTVTAPAVPPPGAVFYGVFRDGLFLANSGYNCANMFSMAAGPTSTFVDILASACNNSPPTTNNAGTSSIGSAGLSSPTLVAVGGGFKDTISGVFTANRTLTLPDSNAIVVGLSTFATLNTAIPVSLCADCNIANPCTGGGTGALAKYLGGVWVCN